jgi:hypothetical protein
MEQQMVKKFIKLNTGNIAFSSNGYYFRLLSKELSEPGLYDANDRLVATWNELITIYGMKCETDYTSSNYLTAETNPSYILNKTDALAAGTKLIIGDTVDRIGDYAFYNCKNLALITIPEGVTSIGNYAFYSCVNLALITIPDSVTDIGINAFYDTAYYKPTETPIYIGNHLIAADRSISGHYKINDGTICIGGAAFSGCAELTEITVPNSIVGIGSNAFCDCYNLTSIEIPNGVTCIHDNTFQACYGLTSITFAEGSKLESIGNNAFYNCRGLTSIEIPESVTSIGNYAFYFCRNLSSVSYHGTKEMWKRISLGTSWRAQSGIREVSCSDGQVAL